MGLSFLAKALACGRGERIYQAFLLRYGYGADFGNADVGHFALLSFGNYNSVALLITL